MADRNVWCRLVCFCVGDGCEQGIGTLPRVQSRLHDNWDIRSRLHNLFLADGRALSIVKSQMFCPVRRCDDLIRADGFPG